MNSFLRFLALSMFVALAIGATSSTFNSFTAFANNVVVTPHTNGVVVSLTGTGWVYGSPIVLAPSASSTTWTTLLRHSGQTAVGLAGVQGGTCTRSPTSKLFFDSPSLIGKGYTRLDSKVAVANCPADIISLYTDGVDSDATSNTIQDSVLVDNEPVKWVWTAPQTQTSTNCYGVTIEIGNKDPIIYLPGTCYAANVISAATSTVNFAFYLETTSTASVCIQTAEQHEINISCGTAKTTSKSASIASVGLTAIVAMISLIFFN